MTSGNNGWGNFAIIPSKNSQESSAIQNNSVTLFAVSIGLLFVTLVNQCYKVITITPTTQITDTNISSNSH